jgi:hypothetical protein
VPALLVATAAAHQQHAADPLSQSPNLLAVDRKNLVQSSKKRRLRDVRKRTTRKQKRISAIVGKMRLVDVVRSEEGSVVATWVKANARSLMRLS